MIYANTRRQPKRCYSQMMRPSGMVVSEVVESKTTIQLACNMFGAALVVPFDSEPIQSPFLALSLILLEKYRKINVMDMNYIHYERFINDRHMYTIDNQHDGCFEQVFLIKKVDAHRVLDLLALPRLMATKNRISFTSEYGFLIFLRYFEMSRVFGHRISLTSCVLLI